MTIPTTPIRRLLILATVTALWQWHGSVHANEPLVFGVLNQQSAARTAQRWNPILKYLGTATGRQFVLRMGPTVKDTNAMMGRGEFDFAYTNHNFRPEYDGQHTVIARLSGKPVFGVIAVPANSPVKKLADLAGKKVAFPSREAFMGYAVPMQALQAAKVSVDAILAGNQDGAIAQLLAGQVDAAAVNSRFLTQYAATRQFAYREVFTSEGYGELPVIAHNRLPPPLVGAVRDALVRMKADPEGAKLLEAAEFSGFDPAQDNQYDNVRRIYKQMK